MLTTQSPPRDVTIPSFDRLPLRGWHWTRPEPRGVIVVAHGFGEHGGCYRHVAEVLGPGADVEVVAPDLRGHGRSPGRRGVVADYEDLVADFRSVLEWTGRVRPGLPRFLLGHSNGGQVVLRLVLQQPPGVTGLVLSNPSLALAAEVPPYKLAIGRLLRKTTPWVTLNASIPADRMTRDPAMQREHETDPLRHSRISAPLFFGMVEGGAMVVARAGEVCLPTLVLLGAADPVINPEITREAFDRFGSTDKTLLIYPKMLHEPLNELGRAQVLSDVINWLSIRLLPAG
ncbi:MAG: lysophospholipase [Isosphaeraceae bacterium]|nr:lysophospholipase [Isosphaeraceae bacterium]